MIAAEVPTDGSGKGNLAESDFFNQIVSAEFAAPNLHALRMDHACQFSRDG